MVNFPRLQIVTLKVGIQTQAGWCQAWVLNHFPDFLSIVKLVFAALLQPGSMHTFESPWTWKSPSPPKALKRKPHPYFFLHCFVHLSLLFTGLFLDPTKLAEKSNFVIFNCPVVKAVGTLGVFVWSMWAQIWRITAAFPSLWVRWTLNQTLDCPLAFARVSQVVLV